MPYERKMSPTESESLWEQERAVSRGPPYALKFTFTPPHCGTGKESRAKWKKKKKDLENHEKTNNINGITVREKIDFKKKMYSTTKEEQFTMIHVSSAKTICACGSKKPKFP